MAELNKTTTELLAGRRDALLRTAADADLDIARAEARAAQYKDDLEAALFESGELAEVLGISKTEQEADYQAALARAEARG